MPAASVPSPFPTLVLAADEPDVLDVDACELFAEPVLTAVPVLLPPTLDPDVARVAVPESAEPLPLLLDEALRLESPPPLSAVDDEPLVPVPSDGPLPLLWPHATVAALIATINARRAHRLQSRTQSPRKS
jgi:hypothetical protein